MIKFKKEEDATYLYLGESCFIHTVNDWKQFIPRKDVKWNWYEFRFIEIYLENDVNFAPGVEFSFVILGLGFRFRYNKPEFNERCKKWDKEIEYQPGKLSGLY